jgi:6-phosphogluconolactonase
MKLFFPTSILLACIVACTQPTTTPTTPPKTAKDPNVLIFAGTYTQRLGHVDGRATGIYTCLFDTVAGTLTVIDSATDIANPSFLTISPDKKYLYAVAENGGSAAQPYGSIAAYQIGEKGKLSKINEVSSYGVAPCHVSTDHTGKWVFVANYGTGNILSYGVQPNGGLSDSLYMHQHPGAHPWAHQVVASPDNTLLYAVDKGVDRIFVYDIAEKGIPKLKTADKQVATAKGAGPRHLDFSPADPTQFAVIYELGNKIATYRRDAATGTIVCTDSMSTLSADFKASNTGADIHYHPNGRFIYGSNRGHNSIAVFQVAPDGRLTSLGQVASGGSTPRNFMITPDGKWLLAANQNSSTVQVYTIDQQTGMPTPTGAPYRVPTPVCLKMW